MANDNIDLVLEMILSMSADSIVQAKTNFNAETTYRRVIKTESLGDLQTAFGQ